MKRIFALLLAVLMLGTLFTACGKKDAADTGNEGASGGEAKEITFPLQEKVEFTAWRTAATSDPKLGIVTYNDIQAVQAWEEKSNVHIEWQIPPSGQEQENFNLMITSGEYPDMIWDTYTYYVGGLDKAIADDVIIDLAPYMDNLLKDYNALISQSDTVYKDCKTDEGHFPGVFFINTPDQGPWYGMSIRKDWLDELGLDMPVTYDDWHDVLTAFKEQKGVTAPLWLNCYAGDVFSCFSAGYGVANINSTQCDGFINENGTVKYSPIEDGYKEYLTMLRDWYAEGLLDPDFYSRQPGYVPPDELYGSNECGAWPDIYTLIGLRGAMSGNPDMDVVAIAQPVKNAGDQLHLRQYNFTRGTGICSISTQCKDKDTLAAYLNLGSTQEWAWLAYYGVEGDTYTVVDGQPVYTDKILNNPDGLSANDAMVKYCFRSAGMYIWDRELQTADDKAKDAINNVWVSNADGDYYMPNITMTSDEAARFATIMGDVETYVAEMTTKFILGTESLDGWDTYVENLKGMNVEEAIQLKQAALDRFNAR